MPGSLNAVFDVVAYNAIIVLQLNLLWPPWWRSVVFLGFPRVPLANIAEVLPLLPQYTAAAATYGMKAWDGGCFITPS